VLVILLSSCALFAQQSPATHPAAKSPKLCVAAIGNGSLKPIFVNEVQDTLVKELTAAGLKVESASSASLVAKKLELSGNNQESMRLRKCEFMLLTAVDSAKAGDATPQPSAGAAASASGAGSGSELLLSFALFRKKVLNPLLDSSVEAPPADTPTHSIENALDKEVDQVRQYFAKK
jgi:hypothetical protein